MFKRRERGLKRFGTFRIVFWILFAFFKPFFASISNVFGGSFVLQTCSHNKLFDPPRHSGEVSGRPRLRWPGDSQRESGGFAQIDSQKKGKAFLLTDGAFLLTVKLLCLQSLEALIRPTVSKEAPTVSTKAKAISRKAKKNCQL